VAVLVTGASGFLGGRLVQMLAARGEEVVLLARGSMALPHLAGLQVRVVRGSLGDAEVLRSAVRGVRHIFHCAACSTDWAKPEIYLEANVLGTQNLLAAALEAERLVRFIHVSTTDVYGYPLLPCAEDHPVVDAGLPYNQTKGRGERAVWDAHRRQGLPVTIVRPATIFGPRGKDFTVEIAAMLRQRLMATIDRGHAPGGFIYVDDVVEGMLAAAASSKALGEAYNLSAGTETTWREYLAIFAERLGTPRPWIDFSFGNAMRAAGAFEAMHRTFGLGGRPLLTRHAVYLLGRNQEFPISKAEADLNFRPAVSIGEGIERSVAWLEDQTRR
jgi:nucleoside-diphosphate-sugar epimerase